MQKLNVGGGLRAGWEECLRRKDRESPPVFVGRLAEIDAFEENVRMASDGLAGSTLFFHGVPGVGKTSLMNECVRRMQGASVGDGLALCVRLPCDEVASAPLEFTHALASAVLREAGRSGERGRRILKALADATAIAKDARAVYKAIDAANGLTMGSSLTSCLNAYAGQIWKRKHTLVVCFDEFQDCEASRTARNATRTLHIRSHEAKIAVACFGLPAMVPMLSDPDQFALSRLSADSLLRVEVMDKDEGCEAIARTLDHLGFAESGGASSKADKVLREEWVSFAESSGFDREARAAWRNDAIKAMDSRCQGFPQHITSGCRALCGMLLERGGEFSPQNNLLQAVAELHEQNKRAYYDQRLSGPLGQHRFALGAVCRLCACSPDGMVAEQDALEMFRAGDDGGGAVPDDQAARMLQDAVRKGVLGDVRVGAIPKVAPPPVPSMEKHLIVMFEEGLEAKHPPVVAMQRKFSAEQEVRLAKGNKARR